MTTLVWRSSVRVAAATLALAATLAAPAARAADKLRYFTWSGYELPAFNQSFLAAHPDGVEIATFGDDDEAFAKLKSGYRSDLAHPCYDQVARWRQEGLLQPIDVARIKNWGSIFPIFRNLPDLQAGDGKVWMAPWDWGNTSILYRTDLVKDPAPSWSLLWDKRYQGRMATIDAVHDTAVVAALLTGVDPFDMTPGQMDKVADKLREQRPLLSSYTTDMTSVEQGLASGQLVAAMTWNASATALRAEGVPVEFMRPKEGMLTWACGFVLLKGAANVDLAYDFINSRLEASSGAALVTTYGYGASNGAAMAEIPRDKLKALQLPDDPQEYLKETIFTGPMKQHDELTRMFERIKAGG